MLNKQNCFDCFDLLSSYQHLDYINNVLRFNCVLRDHNNIFIIVLTIKASTSYQLLVELWLWFFNVKNVWTIKLFVKEKQIKIENWLLGADVLHFQLILSFHHLIIKKLYYKRVVNELWFNKIKQGILLHIDL